MRDYLTRHRQDLLALSVLVLAITLFHARGLLPGHTFLPVDLANNNPPWRSSSIQPLQNWLISDPLYQFYPFLAYAVDSVRHGAWPIWNPHIFLGHPTLADPIAQPFYPVFVALGLVLGAARAIAIGLWLHIILAGVLTYGFLRTLRLGPRAALVGALIYALSGYLVTWFETLFWTSTLAWLPGVLWAFELAIQRRKLGYVSLAALALGLAVLGGQLTFIVTFGLFLGLYAIVRTVELARQHAPRPGWPLPAAAATLGLGAMLGAVQLLPFAEYLPWSQRAVEQGLADPLPLSMLATLILPNLFGNPASIGEYWGPARNFSEATIYAGVVALFLAALAPFVARQRRFFVLSWLLLAAAMVYFIVGGPGVQLLARLPGFDHASLHRSAFILPLLIAVLAAFALDARSGSAVAIVAVAGGLVALAGLAIGRNWDQLQQHWPAVRPFILGSAALLGIAVVLLLWRHWRPGARRWAEWVLILVVFVDLYAFGSRFNPVGRIDQLMPPTPAIEYLQDHAGALRIAPYMRGNTLVLGPNVASIFGLNEGGGYSSVVPASLRLIFELGDPQGRHWNFLGLNEPSTRLLDLLQTGYAVSPVPLDDIGVYTERSVSPCQADSGEITASHSVSGSFRVRDSAINRLDMRFRVLAQPVAPGDLLVRMWQGKDRERLMFETRQDVRELEDGQVTSWYFSPEKDAPGQTYVYEVSVSGPSDRTGVALCTRADGRPAVGAAGVQWSEVYQGEVFIDERMAPMPRAYVVYAAETIGERRQAANRLLDESFDLRNVAVTGQPVGLPGTAPRPATRATIASYGPTRVTIRAVAEQAGLLVLGDQFHPGWRASVDGQPAQVLPVNQVQRGVLLAPGEHQVEFHFAPSSLRRGLALTVTGLLILAGMAAVQHLADRKRGH